jgi:hypothetical protein
MDQAPLVPHAEVVAFVRERKLNDRGIGWIDAHFVMHPPSSDVELWTADLPLATLATLGIAYQ